MGWLQDFALDLRYNARGLAKHKAFTTTAIATLALGIGTPGATLALFKVIGENVATPQAGDADTAKCPRCHGRLRKTQDMQRATKFEYWRCPNEHGRLMTFFDFLKEKDFVRPLTPNQIAELRQTIQMVNCSNCGAPIDLARGSICAHCRGEFVVRPRWRRTDRVGAFTQRRDLNCEGLSIIKRYGHCRLLQGRVDRRHRVDR